MFHHVFFLKKPKGYREGPIPIYLRITIAGKRAELSVKRKIDPSKWISVAGKMKGTTQLARTFNTFLISLENRLYDSYLFLLREKEEITARSLKNKYTGESDKQRMLMAIFQQHNDQIASLVPKQFSKGTLERYKTSMSHTLEFMRFRYQIYDIDVRNIDHEFVEGYDYYLRVVRNCANNSTVKYLKNFKKIIRICIANGWIDRDPFAYYKGKLKGVAAVYLSDDELQIVLKRHLLSIG